MPSFGSAYHGYTCSMHTQSHACESMLIPGMQAIAYIIAFRGFPTFGTDGY